MPHVDINDPWLVLGFPVDVHINHVATKVKLCLEHVRNLFNQPTNLLNDDILV
eukprot:CAMPEP_0168625966 /NCGR_PEP_ID=MMETSP0449_2-20121227/10345_1 /TAXON_ID=1082188 /ORGANISM="Strombidium rassoulzadegani, Strain ras09" /LENGTH=52 /DNA_ID=CAMNT_0008667859 /DNA_START=162 /DNA_END=317 /DNA_ORIENTATION=+